MGNNVLGAVGFSNKLHLGRCTIFFVLTTMMTTTTPWLMTGDNDDEVGKKYSLPSWWVEEQIILSMGAERDTCDCDRCW